MKNTFKLKLLASAVALSCSLSMGTANATGGSFSGFTQDLADPAYWSGHFGHSGITGTIGSTFTDYIAIAFPDFGTAYAGAANVQVGIQPRTGLENVTINQFGLYDTTTSSLVANGISGGGISSFTFTTEANHGYQLLIAGTKDLAGASYAGNISVSPVPEPETYAMLLVGLGLIGFMTSRRKVA